MISNFLIVRIYSNKKVHKEKGINEARLNVKCILLMSFHAIYFCVPRNSNNIKIIITNFYLLRIFLFA